jgi:hypothetical protein
VIAGLVIGICAILIVIEGVRTWHKDAESARHDVMFFISDMNIELNQKFNIIQEVLTADNKI